MCLDSCLSVSGTRNEDKREEPYNMDYESAEFGNGIIAIASSVRNSAAATGGLSDFFVGTEIPPEKLASFRTAFEKKLSESDENGDEDIPSTSSFALCYDEVGNVVSGFMIATGGIYILSKDSADHIPWDVFGEEKVFNRNDIDEEEEVVAIRDGVFLALHYAWRIDLSTTSFNNLQALQLFTRIFEFVHKGIVPSGDENAPSSNEDATSVAEATYGKPPKAPSLTDGLTTMLKNGVAFLILFWWAYSRSSFFWPCLLYLLAFFFLHEAAEGIAAVFFTGKKAIINMITAAVVGIPLLLMWNGCENTPPDTMISVIRKSADMNVFSRAGYYLGYQYNDSEFREKLETAKEQLEALRQLGDVLMDLED